MHRSTIQSYPVALGGQNQEFTFRDSEISGRVIQLIIMLVEKIEKRVIIVRV